MSVIVSSIVRWVSNIVITRWVSCIISCIIVMLHHVSCGHLA